MLPFDPSGVAERLSKNSRTNGECIEWTLSCWTAGYGRIHVRRPDRKEWISLGVHRVAMMLARGDDIHPGWVLHSCDNPVCFNLDHLFLGDAEDNVQDMIRKGRNANQHTIKTECHRGHPLAAGNLYPSTSGRRICAECGRTTAREGAVRRRTHCHLGHSLANVPRNARGTRICPTCSPARARAAALRSAA